MRRRFALVICSSAAAFAVAPAVAAAFRSPARVKSFHGTATIGFKAQNSGPDQGNGGTYSAHLEHILSDVKLNLTHKQVIRNAHTGTHVIFTGGDASIDDTYDDSGAQLSGQETHSGALTNQPPSYGTASLFFDLNKCEYRLMVSFSVVTTVSGSVDAGSHPTVTGTAYGDRNHIPRSLSLSDGIVNPAYGGGCPGNPLKSGDPCYKFGIGIVGICSTSGVGTNDCPPDPGGHADFVWGLKPKK